MAELELQTAAAYIRVSDERQDEFSPDSQLKRIREYCKQNGYILPDEYIFYDDGISGKSTLKRDQFRSLIAIAKEKDHPIDAILVWKFSRFARNQEESIVYKSLLSKINVNVISVSEPLPDGPFGPLVERIIEWMDEYYLIRLSGEVKRGMLEKVSRGGIVSQPPFGYKVENDRYAPDENADIVRYVFESYLSGSGFRKIARTLGARGVVTRFGNPPDNRFVEYMLNNPVYIGKLRWSGDGRIASRRKYDSPDMIIVDGSHTPIISQDVWDRTQALLAKNKALNQKHRCRDMQPAAYMLRGIYRCSECGGTLVRVTSYPSMQCHNYSRGICKRSHHISMKVAIDAVLGAMQRAVDTMDIQITQPEPAHIESPDDDLIRKKIETEQRRLQRAIEAYQAGIDTLDEYSENKHKITDRIRDLEQQLSPPDDPAPIQREEYAVRIRDVLAIVQSNADEDIKNKALHSIIDRAVYNADTKTVDVFFQSL